MIKSDIEVLGRRGKDGAYEKEMAGTGIVP